MKNDIRPSPISGTWYSGDSIELKKDLDNYFSLAAKPVHLGKLIGLVTPHAGYRYSGKVAASAFQLAQGLTPSLVVILSPMHTLAPAPLITSAHSAYQTPLGDVPVDQDAIQALSDALKRRAGFGLFPVRRDREHALEIELPFLQYALGEFRLLPVMVLDQREDTMRLLGDALAEILLGREALLVASTDLSHFYPARIAAELDREMLRRIEAMDPSAIIRAEGEGAAFACGRAAVAAMLWTAKALGADRVSIVDYATSGEVTGDDDSVVGYGAAAVWKASPD